MGKGKQGAIVVRNGELVTHFKNNLKPVETLFKSWLKHTEPVRAAIDTCLTAAFEVASETAFGAIKGATLAYVVKSLHGNPEGLRLPLSGGVFVNAPYSAAWMGSYAAIYGVMRRSRGKEDSMTQASITWLELYQFIIFKLELVVYEVIDTLELSSTRLSVLQCFDFFARIEAVSLPSGRGFGAAVIFSKVSGARVGDVISNGLIFALIDIVAYKRRCAKVKDKLFTETRGMLSSLGLEEYEKKFKKGMFTDKSLPFLTNSDLQEVRIPPGARRLILDHIRRENEMKQGGGKKADIFG